MKNILRGIWAGTHALARRDDGHVAIITALTLPVLVLGIGGAMDYSRVLAAKSKLQAATDSAALATYAHHATKPDLSDSQLQAYFANQLQASLNSKLETLIQVRQLSVQYDTHNNQLVTSVSADFPTSFLRIAGITTMNMRTQAEVKGSRTYTEVALVLDTTGSMEGSKLAELKQAAKQFIDDIHARVNNSGQDNFRIAIVPFTQYVNIGTDNRNASWADIPADQETRYLNSRRWIRWQGCVGSRPYPYNVQDGSYTLHKVPGVMEWARRGLYAESDYREYFWDNYNIGNFCPSPITPLMSVRTQAAQLKQRIDALHASGWTYIPAGLVWGWRVLSPQAPFTEGLDDAEFKRRGGQRFIILMTDGANTKAPYRNIYKEHIDGAPYSDFRISYANQLTREACDNIKMVNPGTGQRNAEIITITFDVQDDTIKALMRECATMGSYDVSSGQLVQLFRDLAEKLVEVHLSK